jgi:ankyrin repeat protein
LKDHDGRTALLHAAEAGQTEAVEALLEASADVDVRGPNGVSPLMAAASRGHVEIVKALVAGGADLHARDDESRTALDYVEESNRAKLAPLLSRDPVKH